MRTNNPRGQVLWVRRLHVMSMLLVTLHHSIPHGYDGPDWLLRLLNAIQYPALACFFFTSGLFAAHWRQTGWRAYMKRRFVRLMAPFFALNLLMLAPRYAVSRMMNARPNLSLGWLAMSFLDPHRQGIAPHLWFLPALLALSALLPLVDAAVRPSRKVRAAVVAALLVLSALPVQAPSVLCLDELKRYAVCYVLGYALGEPWALRTPLRGPIALAAGGLGLAAFALSLLPQAAPVAPFLQMAGGGLAMAVASGCVRRPDPVTDAFGDRTFVIYLLSMGVQNLVDVLCYVARLPWFVSLPVMFAAGLATPCALYALNARRPLPKPVRLIAGL